MRNLTFRVKRSGKYNNRSCYCHQQHWHQSNGEAQYCDELALLVMRHDILRVEQQKTFDLVVNGKKICGYRMDFVVTENDGTLRCIEYKGFETEVYRLKAKLFEACYPDMKYDVVHHREPYNIFKNKKRNFYNQKLGGLT